MHAQLHGRQLTAWVVLWLAFCVSLRAAACPPLQSGAAAQGLHSLPRAWQRIARQTSQVLGTKVRLMSLQESLLEIELDAVDAVGQLCQVRTHRIGSIYVCAVWLV